MNMMAGVKGGALPLSKMTVLDLTQARAGPTCARHLADWGANVICIQPTGETREDAAGSRDGSDRQNLYRNKRMIQLNLKSPEGHATFMRLVKQADVVIENMRPDVKHRLKIDWENVQAVNPRVVYGSISGFGQDGPYGKRGGVDQIAQGMGGLMSITGEPGQGPMRVGIAINDVVAGTLLALGVMMALFERQSTGAGRWIYTSLLETQLFLLDFQAARWLMDGQVPQQVGNNHPTGTPSSAFQTSDGYVNLAGTGSPKGWFAICDVLGRPDWKEKPEWRTGKGRTKDRPQLNRMVSDIMRQKPTAHWVEQFERAGVPCGPIYTIDQAFSDPQVEHLGMAVKVKHPVFGDTRMVGSPLNFDGAPKEVRIPFKRAGEDTDDVLREAGLTAQEITDLRAMNAIQ